jgi:DNA-binding transcriptional MocR family regulator
VVIHCSSVSKVLGPGFRVGWSISRKFRPLIEQSQFLQSISCPTLTQEVVAEFLSCDGLRRHSRLTGNKLAMYAQSYRAALQEVLPADSRITRPLGGFLLWIELPHGTDTTQLFHSLASAHTGLTPGIIFGNHRDAKRFFRFPFGTSLSSRIEQSIRLIGDATHRQIKARH